MVFNIAQTWDIYHGWLYSSKFIVERLLPYRDFSFEYPPLAIIFFAIPRIFANNPIFYARLFNIFALLTVAFLAWLIRKKNKNPFIFLTAATALFPFIIERYDIFVSAIVFLAVLFIDKKKYLAGWLLLAVGVLAKLYPFVLAPLFFMKNKSLKNVVIFLFFIFVGFGYPFFQFKQGFMEFIQFQKTRSLQAESFYSLYLYPRAVINKEKINRIYNKKFFEIEFESEEKKELWIKISNYGLAILLLLSCFAVYLRKKESIFALAIIPITAFIIGNKVFACQYLIWVIPFIPFLRKTDIIFFTTSFFLTIWYYGFYSELGYSIEAANIFQKELPAIQIILLRNIFILIVFIRLLIQKPLESRRSL